MRWRTSSAEPHRRLISEIWTHSEAGDMPRKICRRVLANSSGRSTGRFPIRVGEGTTVREFASMAFKTAGIDLEMEGARRGRNWLLQPYRPRPGARKPGAFSSRRVDFFICERCSQETASGFLKGSGRDQICSVLRRYTGPLRRVAES
jgi:hypothetical protein